MDTEKMEAWLRTGKNFWEDCNLTMAKTYLEGIRKTEIPEPPLLPLLSILSLILLPPTLRRKSTQAHNPD
jgi:hypothetical protein